MPCPYGNDQHSLLAITVLTLSAPKALIMEKPSSVTHHEEMLDSNELKHSVTETKGAIADRITEHQLTLKEVWKSHPALVGWSLYWSMCAIGW